LYWTGLLTFLTENMVMKRLNSEIRPLIGWLPMLLLAFILLLQPANCYLALQYYHPLSPSSTATLLSVGVSSEAVKLPL